MRLRPARGPRWAARACGALSADARHSGRRHRAGVRARESPGCLRPGADASPWTRDPDFAKSVKEVHEWLADALMLLAFAHAAAALAHHWVLHDSTLRRMLPGRAS
ncbi:MAG TPA: cytochrome b/b6 domain-containing protein [Rhodoplanes sp.]|nr:cytochrome b/b6 domain-containing protein [Rhodoplanes sp.]